VYAREIDGREFSFGVSGKLIRNVLVMYDRQTESYWSQLLGESVEGEMIGTKLDFLPSWMMNWEAWKGIHPDTVALHKGGMRGGRDTYESYYRSSSAGVIGETLFDDRLYTKEFVVGVEIGSASIAYPFSALNDEPIVNDTVEGTDLLVVFDKESAASAVFSRKLGEQTLTFTSDSSDRIMVDEETESRWDSLSGLAISGPLAGGQLERIKSTTSFWFGWKDFHPDTAVYGLDG
jgi:hypothetical protein